MVADMMANMVTDMVDDKVGEKKIALKKKEFLLRAGGQSDGFIAILWQK